VNKESKINSGVNGAILAKSVTFSEENERTLVPVVTAGKSGFASI